MNDLNSFFMVKEQTFESDQTTLTNNHHHSSNFTSCTLFKKFKKQSSSRNFESHCNLQFKSAHLSLKKPVEFFLLIVTSTLNSQIIDQSYFEGRCLANWFMVVSKDPDLFALSTLSKFLLSIPALIFGYQIMGAQVLGELHRFKISV